MEPLKLGRVVRRQEAEEAGSEEDLEQWMWGGNKSHRRKKWGRLLGPLTADEQRF